jgi:16S rRNA processing protein RimM
MMIRKEDLFQIGQFTKPHGIKGELALATAYEELLDGGECPFLVCEMEGIPVPFHIESCRPKGRSGLLIKLEQIEDDISAKRFINRPVYVPRTARMDDMDENTTWSRFNGYMLEDERMGVIGRVTDVDETTINVLFTVDYLGKELLAPVAGELIRSVDRTNRRLVVSLPDGLLEM